MFKLPVSLIAIAVTCAVAAPSSARAADLPYRHRAAEEPARRMDGICPCYTYTVRHKVLLSTYGTDLDPRNYDFTEPHYFFGGVKTFRRYSNAPIE